MSFPLLLCGSLPGDVLDPDTADRGQRLADALHAFEGRGADLIGTTAQLIRSCLELGVEGRVRFVKHQEGQLAAGLRVLVEYGGAAETGMLEVFLCFLRKAAFRGVKLPDGHRLGAVLQFLGHVAVLGGILVLEIGSIHLGEVVLYDLEGFDLLVEVFHLLLDIRSHLFGNLLKSFRFFLPDRCRFLRRIIVKNTQGGLKHRTGGVDLLQHFGEGIGQLCQRLCGFVGICVSSSSRVLNDIVNLGIDIPHADVGRVVVYRAEGIADRFLEIRQLLLLLIGEGSPFLPSLTLPFLIFRIVVDRFSPFLHGRDSLFAPGSFRLAAAL